MRYRYFQGNIWNIRYQRQSKKIIIQINKLLKEEDDMSEYAEQREKVIQYLSSLEGKGVDTIANITKGTGIKRRDLSKVLQKMELDGEVQAAGVMAGVAGYKLTK